MPTDIKSLTREELEAQFAAWEQPVYRVKQLMDWLYVQRVTDWDAMTNLPKALREKLRQEFSLGSLELVRKQGARDTTQKFLWRLADHALIESVLIPANPVALWRTQRPPHALRLHAGRLRLWLQVLRERPGWLETQSAAARNRRAGAGRRALECGEQSKSKSRVEESQARSRRRPLDHSHAFAPRIPATAFPARASWTTSSSWAWANRSPTTTTC